MITSAAVGVMLPNVRHMTERAPTIRVAAILIDMVRSQAIEVKQSLVAAARGPTARPETAQRKVQRADRGENEGRLSRR